jgi:hypothetical protein
MSKELETGRWRRRLGIAAMLSIPAMGPVASSVLAQATFPPAVESQCRDDYFRHCSVYQLGSDELRRCMEAKGRNLSPKCKQALRDAGFARGGRDRR